MIFVCAVWFSHFVAAGPDYVMEILNRNKMMLRDEGSGGGLDRANPKG